MAPPVAGCGAGSSSPGLMGEVEGAGVVAEVVVAVGGGPEVGAGLGHCVVPAAVGLDPVVGAAQRCDLVGTCRPTMGVGGGVVGIAAVLNRPGVSGGPGRCLYPVGTRRFLAA